MGESGPSVGPGWYQAWGEGWYRAQLRRGRAAASLRTWSVYLRNFGRFLEEEGVSSPDELTRDLLERWQDGLRDHLLPASQQVAVHSVRALLKWADLEEVSTRAGLWARLETPAIPERLPRALEPNELRAILEHYRPHRRNLIWLRDRALFWFLLTSGARISEALQVDVDQVGEAMVVLQKGGREHRLVISARSRQWLGDYLRLRGRDLEPALWIHVGQRGRFRMRDDQVNEVWTRLAEQLHIRRFTSHALRHSAATELGELGVRDQDVSKHLGWRGLGQLVRYQELREARRQEFVNRLDDLIPPWPAPPEPRRRRRGRRYRVVQGS
jgi:integrase/recombinase XerD